MGELLEINLLGTLRVAYGSLILSPLPTRKSALLLGYLALHRAEPVDRNRLASLLWPDVPDPRARRNLNTELWRLRQACGSIDLLTADLHLHTVKFTPSLPYQLDIELLESIDNSSAIEHLTEIAKLYDGDFLSGFYEDWVLEAQERLRGQYLVALERLAYHYEANVNYVRAIEYSQRLLAFDPLREEIHRQLIRLYAANGDRGSAIRQYRRCVEILEQELRIGPLPETVALYQSLIGNPAASNQSTSALATGMTFVGRGDELGRLQTARAASCQGRGQLVVVHGESGIGKTRLVDEWLARLGTDGIHLKARCLESAEHTPYQPILTALRHLPPSLWAKQWQGVPQQWLAEAVQIFPEIRTRWPRLPATLDQTPQLARERLLTALTHCLQALILPEQPFVLIVDDLHWADNATLELLDRLIQSSLDRSVLLIVTYRTEALELTAYHPLHQWLANQATDYTTTITVQALSGQQTAELLWQMSGSQRPPTAFADSLYSETEGHPLFVIETLRALFDSGYLAVNTDGVWSIPLHHRADDVAQLPLPGTIRGVIQTRLDRLSADQRAALTAAAVIGREFDFALLETVTGQADVALLDNLAVLRRAGLIRDLAGGLRFDFSHDKIREVIYEGLGEAERRAFHRRVGQALEKQAVEADVGLLEPLAYHYAHSDDLAAAVKYLKQAGDQAQKIWAFGAAATHYEEALAIARLSSSLSLDERWQLYLAWWYCCEVMGWHDRLVKVLAEAERLAQQMGDQARLAQIWRLLGGNQVARGAWQEGKALLDQSLSLALQLNHLGLEGHIRADLAIVHQFLRETELSLSHSARVLQIANELNDTELRWSAQINLVATDSPAAQMPVYRQVLAEALAENRVGYLVSMASDVITTARMAGFFGEALEHGASLLSIARQQAVVALERSLMRSLSQLHLDIGDYETARQYAQHALRLCRLTGYRYGEMRASACLGLATGYAGHIVEALELLRKAIGHLQKMGVWQDVAAFQYQAALVALFHHPTAYLETAHELAIHCLATARPVNFARAEMVALSILAEIALRRGDHGIANQTSNQALTLLNERGHANGHEPFILSTHYHVMSALNDATALNTLQRARQLLATRACTLHSHLRRSFFHAVPLNQAILTTH